jgi:hypothetical protein
MTLKIRNKQKSQEVKLLAEEDKNTRKCQKESKKRICTKTRAIVATMTPIVSRWEQTYRPRQARVSSEFWKQIFSVWHGEIHRSHHESESHFQKL